MEYGLLRKGSIQTEGGLTMAKEFIEREAAKVRLRMWITDCVLDGNNEAADCFRGCIDLLDSIPAADVVPVVHGEPTEHLRELLRAEKDGRLVVLPCRVGDRIYRVIDDCTFPGDCGTKRMCKGCEYRNLFIEQTTFRLYLLTDDGKLRRGYYRTREEAETALEGNNG